MMSPLSIAQFLDPKSIDLEQINIIKEHLELAKKTEELNNTIVYC